MSRTPKNPQLWRDIETMLDGEETEARIMFDCADVKDAHNTAAALALQRKKRGWPVKISAQGNAVSITRKAVAEVAPVGETMEATEL